MLWASFGHHHRRKNQQCMWYVSQMHKQQKLTKMGENGRAMVAQEFEWHHIASQLVQVYAA